MRVTSGRFGSFLGEFTELITGESAEPTGSVGLADLGESTWLFRAVGLVDWDFAEGESTEPTRVVGLAD